MRRLQEGRGWIALPHGRLLQLAIIQGAGRTLAGLMRTYLAGYDEEALYFDPGEKRLPPRVLLKEEVEGMVRPAWDAQLALARTLAVNAFATQMGVTREKEGFVDRARRCTTAAVAQFDTLVATELLVPGVRGSEPCCSEGAAGEGSRGTRCSAAVSGVEAAVAARRCRGGGSRGARAAPVSNPASRSLAPVEPAIVDSAVAGQSSS